MSIWLRRYIGFTGICGGVTGVILVLSTMSSEHSFATNAIFVFGLLFYAWTAVIGTLILEGSEAKVILVQAFTIQVMQVPTIILPFLAYKLTSGFECIVAMNIEGILSGSASTSASLNLQLFSIGEVPKFGVNIAALVVSVLLWKYMATLRDANLKDVELEASQTE